MARGIAQFANETFLSNLTVFGTEGGKEFRKTVIDKIVNEFGISRASANTHYNNAFQQAKLYCPQMVEGLGRAPDKIGGRPAQIVVDVVKASTGEVVAKGVSRNLAKRMIEKAVVRRQATLKVAEPAVLDLSALTDPAPAATEATVEAVADTVAQ